MDLNVTNSFRKIYTKFLKYKYRIIIAYGGSRSGKTFAILQILLIILLSKKNKKITVWRNIGVICRSTVMEDFKKILDSSPAIKKQFKENKSKATFTCIRTGSKIVFEGADDIGKVLGSAQDYSYFNEITEMNEAVFRQITQRTADTIFADYNPSKSFFLDKYRAKDNAIFIHSDYRDNYMCPANIVEQLNSYNPWEEGSYEVKNMDIYVNGKIMSDKNKPKPNKKNIREGTVSEYDWLVYGLGLKAEKPEKIYKGWIPITEKEFTNVKRDKYYGLDFGTAKPTALVEIKFDGDKSFFIRERMYKPSGLIGNIPKMIDSSIPNKEDMIIADSAKRTYIDMLNRSGYNVVGAFKGNDSVSSGITLVQSFNIYYVPTKNIENEYTTYSFKVDRYGLATDDPIKKDDHLMDAIRYGITYLYYYLGGELM